jgi:hypothetical protein
LDIEQPRSGVILELVENHLSECPLNPYEVESALIIVSATFPSNVGGLSENPGTLSKKYTLLFFLYFSISCKSSKRIYKVASCAFFAIG